MKYSQATYWLISEAGCSGWKGRADPGGVHQVSSTATKANEKLKSDTSSTHFVELHSKTCDAKVLSPKAAVYLLEKNIKLLSIAPLSESRPL